MKTFSNNQKKEELKDRKGEMSISNAFPLQWDETQTLPTDEVLDHYMRGM